MKPELRREQMLRAATKVFAAKGYHRASVSDIIEAAGVARGTFYLYFEGKREIFAELVDVLTVRIVNCMKLVDLSPGAPPWQDQVRTNVIRIATILAEENELTQVLYSHALGLDEDFDKKIREFFDNLTDRVEKAVRLGQQMGLVRSDLSPRLAASHILGSTKEVMYRMARGELKLSVEKMVDELTTYYTQGMMHSPEAPKTNRKK